MNLLPADLAPTGWLITIALLFAIYALAVRE